MGLFGYDAGAVLIHLMRDVEGYAIPAGYAVLALVAAAIRMRTANPAVGAITS